MYSLKIIFDDYVSITRLGDIAVKHTTAIHRRDTFRSIDVICLLANENSKSNNNHLVFETVDSKFQSGAKSQQVRPSLA